MSEQLQQSSQKGVNVGIVFTMCLLVLFANGFSLFKTIPIMTTMMTAFQVDTGMMGVLNSAYNWASLILMIPIGYFVRQTRPRVAVGVGGIVTIIGHLIPLMAQTSFLALTVGRMVEGVGSNCLIMVAASLITTLFMGRKGMSTAISTTIAAPMVAQFVHLNIAGRVVPAYGWQGVYVYITVFQAVSVVLFILFCGSKITIAGTTQAETNSAKNTAHIYKNSNLWLISIALALFTIATVTFGTYVPVYFQDLGMTEVQANGMYSISTVLGLVAMLVSGIIADRCKGVRKVAIISFLGGVLAFILLMLLPVNLMIIYILVYGTIPRAVNPMSQAAIPSVVDDKLDVPIAKSLMETVGKIFNLFSAIVVGFLIQLGGWPLSMTVLAICMAVGAILWILARRIP